MENKLLFAINHKKAEDGIAIKIKPDYMVVGTVQYREAVVNSLISSGANILLIRESLPGHLNFFSLIKDVRIQLPHVRVICMINERDDPADKILSGLVSLGIYDILNMNSVSIDDISSYILDPRSFRDVAHYYDGIPEFARSHGSNEEDMSNEGSESAKKGSWIFGKRKKQAAKAIKDAEITSGTEASLVSPNYEAMRKAIQEEADRKAQLQMAEIVESMSDSKNAMLTQELEKKTQEYALLLQEKSAADQQKFQVTKDLDISVRKAHALEQELKRIKESGSAALTEMSSQIESLRSAETPEWFSQKMVEWSAREKEYQAQVHALQSEINDIKGKATHQLVDISSLTDADFILPDTQDDYIAVENGKTHVYLFSGTKHGVGNTTVSMNAAAAFAEKGFKTLYVEMNSRYPLINEFFEFINIQRGIDTAIQGLKEGKRLAVDAAIIKPHGLTTSNKQLSKVYNKLPGALHFMLFSNLYLKQQKNGVNTPFDMKDISALFHYIVEDLGYLYLIIDIQPDDAMGEVILHSGEMIDQIVLTCTQDPHSITTTGLLITEMARSSAARLLPTTQIVVNQFNQVNDLSISKISKWLNLPTKRFSHLSEDRPGYLKAAGNMLPYVLGQNKFSREYQELLAEI